MTTIDQPSFEAGLRTAVDLANAAASRLEASGQDADPKHTAAIGGLRSYADGIQAMLDAREADPIGYTVRAITKGH